MPGMVDAKACTEYSATATFLRGLGWESVEGVKANEIDDRADELRDNDALSLKDVSKS